MKHNLLKTLLVSALALGAWGGVSAKTELLSENFDSETYNVTYGGTSQGGATVSINDGGLLIQNNKASGDRSAYVSFGDKSLTKSGRLTFDMALTKSGWSGKNNTVTICESIETGRYVTNSAILSIVQDGNGKISIGEEEIGTYNGTVLTYDIILNTTAESANISVKNGTTLIKEFDISTTSKSISSMHAIVNKNYGACSLDNIQLYSLDNPNITLSESDLSLSENQTSNLSFSNVIGTVSVESDDESIATVEVKDSEIEVKGLKSGIAHLIITVTNDGLELKKTITITVGSVQTTDVTVNYLSEGSNIADSYVISDVPVGKELDESDFNIQSILYNTDSTIRYVNPTTDVNTPYTVIENGVVNVNYTQQRKISTVQVDYICGDETVAEDNVALDGCFEGDVVNVPFRYYLRGNDDNLYQSKNNTSGSYYRESITLSASDNVVNKTVTKAYDKSEVVLFEDLDGSADKNADTRASYGSAYNNKSYTSTKQITPGKYTVLVRVGYVGRGSSLTIGDTEICQSSEITRNSWGNITKTDVEISKRGVVAWKGTSATDPIDIILIVKTGDATTETATITDAGFATYVPSNKVVVPENVTVYTAKVVADNKVNLTAVEAGTILKAGEGVVIAGAAGDYSFTVTEDAAATLDNDLKAATADVTADGTQYVLAKQDTNVGFSLVEEGSTIAAGKAYLEVSSADQTSAKAFLAIGGGSTGVEAIEAAAADNDIYYSISGVKTTKPAKGLYIHNGKKVIVK